MKSLFDAATDAVGTGAALSARAKAQPNEPSRRQMMGAVGLVGLSSVLVSSGLDLFERSGASGYGSSDATDIVVSGSGVATLGYAVALALNGRRPAVMLEPSPALAASGVPERLWIPNNRFMQARGIADPREDAYRFMTRAIFPRLYREDVAGHGIRDPLGEVLLAYYDHAAHVADELESAGVLAFHPATADRFHDFLGGVPPVGRALGVVDIGQGPTGGKVAAGLHAWLTSRGAPVIAVERIQGAAVSEAARLYRLPTSARLLAHAAYATLLGGGQWRRGSRSAGPFAEIAIHEAAALLQLWGEGGPLIFGYLAGLAAASPVGVSKA